jgi:hypothetical protein
LLYPAQATAFVDELRDDDWELIESRQVFEQIRLQQAAGGLPERAAVLRELAEPVAEWLEQVLRIEDVRPPLDERYARAEQEKCLREMRRRYYRASIASYTTLLSDLEGSTESAEEREVCQRVERELVQLQTAERLTKSARIWSIAAN